MVAIKNIFEQGGAWWFQAGDRSASRKSGGDVSVTWGK